MQKMLRIGRGPSLSDKSYKSVMKWKGSGRNVRNKINMILLAVIFKFLLSLNFVNFVSCEKQDENENVRKVMLLGLTGSGKSTLADIFIGENPNAIDPLSNCQINCTQGYFQVSGADNVAKRQTNQATSNPPPYPYFLNNPKYKIKIKVIDTPGLGDPADTDNLTEDADAQHIFKIQKFYNEELNLKNGTSSGSDGRGPMDAFVLVLKFGRIKTELINSLELMTRGFGATFWENTIIVYNFIEWLTAENDQIIDKIKDQYAEEIKKHVHKKMIHSISVENPENYKKKLDHKFFKDRIVFLDAKPMILHWRGKSSNPEELKYFNQGAENFVKILNSHHKHPFKIPMKPAETNFQKQLALEEEIKCLSSGNSTWIKNENAKGKCQENTCTCKNGNPVKNNLCPMNNLELCASCEANFTLKGNTCQPLNNCFCMNGTALTNDKCPWNGFEWCAFCDVGFELMADSLGMKCKSVELGRDGTTLANNTAKANFSNFWSSTNGIILMVSVVILMVGLVLYSVVFICQKFSD